MKFYVNENAPVAESEGQLHIVCCFEEDLQQDEIAAENIVLEPATGSFCQTNHCFENALLRRARAETFTASPGKALVHLVDDDGAKVGRVMLLGLGKGDKFSLDVLKKALVKAFTDVKKLEIDDVTISAQPILARGIDAYALGQVIGAYAGLLDYNPKHYKTKKGGHKGDPNIATLKLLSDEGVHDELRRGLKDGRAIATGVNLARDLTTVPAGKLPPMALKAAAETVVRDSRGLITGKYYWGKRLEQMKANALLAVAAGSTQKPVIIELDYTPPCGPTKNVLCLVGKSITFDSGGLNLKQGDGMRHMKRDMAGGATVLGAIQAIAALELPISVKVVMAAAENMTGPAAYKPGDVIETMSGLTVEVDNTDAEGRLTLIDAIEFAKRRGVSHIVDFATLTGAVKSIGGDVAAAAFGNKRDFTEMVANAGESQSERMIVMPMLEELRDSNDSDIADMKNSGGPLAGSMTAAWFIREVAGEEIPWVHLDIAGVAYRTRSLGPDPKGATGFGVRTAVALASTLAAEKR